MAELDSRTPDGASSAGATTSPTARRRPRRKAGAPAGAPSPTVDTPVAAQPSTITHLSSQTATVVADAAPLNLRARRLAERAARDTQREAEVSPATEAHVPAEAPEQPEDHSSPTADITSDLSALAASRKGDDTPPSQRPALMDTQEFASLLFRAPVAEESVSSDPQVEEDAEFVEVSTFVSFDAPDLESIRERATRRRNSHAGDSENDLDDASNDPTEDDNGEDSSGSDDQESRSSRRRRRGGRGRRGRGRSDEERSNDGDDSSHGSTNTGDSADVEPASQSRSDDNSATDTDEDNQGSSTRRRRRRRRSSGPDTDEQHPDDPPNTVVRVREGRDEVKAVKGSTRLEAKRQRRKEGRESGRRRHSITESEFLARRESVKRSMIVRERPGRTQIVVLEDNILVEHYVAQKAHTSMVGNVYLGKVQNVLPSMEAAFVDIGKGRNAVLYAGEVNWDAAGLDGQPRRIELALKAGDPVLVQVTKDPIGHKGARLTSQISLPGRYLVYVPGGSMTGISRKLPDNERSRLKKILKTVVPEDAGVIVRTAAEGASEEELTRDVERLQHQWEKITKKSKTKGAPAPLSTEPDLAIKVVRDIFNEDFTSLVVEGEDAYKELHEYVSEVAPDLLERVTKHVGPKDSFAKYKVDEQLMKAMDRKVYLPSGGSLVIDRTEAMTVVDVNTGKFTGSGGSLEETVTRNNLEAAEEIVRQLRLRDIGGIIVVDFIDMVLESNRDLVLRRMIECLSRDRTKHQVAEVTSLGLVQMTRKRVGAGLVETFSTMCEHCNGRGIQIDLDGQPHIEAPAFDDDSSIRGKSRRRSKRGSKNEQERSAREAKNESAQESERSSGGSASDAVKELVDSKNSSDVHRLEEDEKSRALAAATIASIAAASAADSHPEVTVDGQVITASDVTDGEESTEG